ncbi:MAG: hypothetical protein FWG74_07120 [Planctomycetes bacterium]|nr:hypothetical protein [Planctomycetota bacterium]
MIEQMTHVAVLAKSADRDELLEWLYGERNFHVMPIDDESEEWTRSFNLLPDDSQNIDSNLSRINSVVSFCQEYVTNKPGFLDAMLPLKVVGSKAEIDSAVEEVSIDLLARKVSEMRAGIENSNERIARLQAHKISVEQFAFLGDDLPKLTQLKHVKIEAVAVPGQGGGAFLLDERIVSGRIVAWGLFADRTLSYYALAAPVAESDLLKALLDDHGLHLHPIPRIRHGADQEMLLINNDIFEANALLEKQKAEATRFADAWLRKTSLAAGYWDSEKNLAQSRNGMSESSHLFVTRGYLKSENLVSFNKKLADRIAGATILPCAAPAEEDPPVSMKWNKWISPASLIVKMYGIPSYKGLDPTPYVASIFFLFVGICLGDAAYGLALVCIMRWLKNKYREQAHLQDFFQAFVYCGYSAMVFGVLTGSFMGNLSAYLPGLGWFDNIRNGLAVIDPIKNSQTALYIAIGIGIFTQLYGMTLNFYKHWLRGDKMSAFSDGALWAFFLIFAILGGLTGSSFFWFLFVAVIVLLILTQGRDQKNWFARIMVGVIALYGIVGSYGASAVMGDLISYARLMALGLTGAALGSTFNMLAELSVKIPFIGVIIGTIIVICGHSMNFFLSLLGGFVHSARLVMLEFFGRFYESGGSAYKPYGFNSQTVDMKRG